MPTTTAAREYQQNQILTAGRSQLLLLTYDGALRFLNLARGHMQARQYEAQHNNIVRTQAILLELRNSLDPAVDTEMAASLHAIYTYLYNRLTHANVRDDEQALGEVIAHLAELREAWSRAAVTCAASPA